MGTALLNPPIYPSRAADFSPLFSCTLPALLRQRIAGLRPDWRRSFRNKSSCKIRAQLRDRWLESLAGGSNGAAGNGLVVVSREEAERSDEDGQAWVIGIDPDVSGALAVVKGSETGCSAEVFDSPHSQVPVGKGMRKRLNPKSMVQIIRSLNAPVGTVAYIEQSSPFPKDGKQGWWSGGFGYGVWIGVLVASGFSVIPVPSVLWKANFGLLGRSFSKDDSRVAARELFPALSPMLKRKMDHGRAEALLIAAYGKGLKREKETAVAACTSET